METEAKDLPKGQVIDDFEKKRALFAKKLEDLFSEMAKQGVGLSWTHMIEETFIGKTPIRKVVGVNYTLHPIPKPAPSKKEQDEKRKNRKKKK